jgi:hypothetical protein
VMGDQDPQASVVAEGTVDPSVGPVGDHHSARALWPSADPADDVANADDRPVRLDRHVAKPFATALRRDRLAAVGRLREDLAVVAEATVEPALSREEGQGRGEGADVFGIPRDPPGAVVCLSRDRLVLQIGAFEVIPRRPSGCIAPRRSAVRIRLAPSPRRPCKRATSDSGESGADPAAPLDAPTTRLTWIPRPSARRGPGLTASVPWPGCCGRPRSATGRPASPGPRCNSPCHPR